MRFFLSVLSICLGVLMSSNSEAKELANRLGVGFRNAYSFELPSLAASYYFNSNYGVIGALGVDTEDQSSKFAFSAGLHRIIFKEDNMNFYMGGVLSTVSREVLGQTSSGFELSGLIGSEFFLQGLDSIGFSVESGIGVSNMSKVRFRTIGDSFLRAGILFYF